MLASATEASSATAPAIAAEPDVTEAVSEVVDESSAAAARRANAALTMSWYLVRWFRGCVQLGSAHWGDAAHPAAR